MSCCAHKFCSYVPPYIFDQLAKSEDPMIREKAMRNLAIAAEFRTTRQLYAETRGMAGIQSLSQDLERGIYDMQHRTSRFLMPGKFVRAEGAPKHADEAVNEAYDYSGIVYDFYKKVLGRNSLDNKGMKLISSVHFGDEYNNAFWNGRQMAYGDGDQIIFKCFTKSLDVIGHELSHGVISFTSDLEYYGEPGALNEHFADVMGTMVQQWHENKTANKADWLIGNEIMVSAPALRTFRDQKAYKDDPYLGTDPQPKHYKDKYEGEQDNAGVHINSGIPNHAFYTVAMELGGKAWEKAGIIWYEAFTKRLHSTSDFQDAANTTYSVAGTLYDEGSKEQEAVKKGWAKVGIEVRTPALVG